MNIFNFIINIYSERVFFFTLTYHQRVNICTQTILCSISTEIHTYKIYCCGIYTGGKSWKSLVGFDKDIWQRQCLSMNQPSCNDVSDTHFKVVNNHQLDMINLWSALKQCYTIIFTCKVIFNHFNTVQNLGLN